MIFVTYLLRGVVALGPDDLHPFPILALETFDFGRDLLIEEISISRVGMNFMVIWSWYRCLRNPIEVLV